MSRCLNREGHGITRSDDPADRLLLDLRPQWNHSPAGLHVGPWSRSQGGHTRTVRSDRINVKSGVSAQADVKQYFVAYCPIIVLRIVESRRDVGLSGRSMDYGIHRVGVTCG